MRRVEEILAKRRAENEKDMEKRRAFVYEKFPQIKDFDIEIRSLNIERISALVNGRDPDGLSRDIEEVEKRKEEFLKNNKIDKDYDRLRYHCPICKDTGVYGSKICNCKKQLIIEGLYDQSKLANVLNKENFSKFNLDKFRKSRMANESLSPYENMKNIYANMKEYSESFSPKSPNLFLFGQVGTGKTFIANCIAKEVLDKGYSVLYLSINDMLDSLNSYQFAPAQNKQDMRLKIDFIYNADLLVIDDLGTEYVTEFTKSYLFEVINQRMVQGKATIISSNLDLDKIQEVYDQRLFSRILGNYIPLEFYGNDLRLGGFL
ncbi:ATP-binding protein [Peptoniphilaceae bacterium SGI.131]